MQSLPFVSNEIGKSRAEKAQANAMGGYNRSGFEGAIASEWSQSGPMSLFQIPQSCHQRIDLFAGVVKSERCADGALEAEAAMNRLCAMMAGANGDAFPIERGADVFRAKPIEHEGKEASLFFCRADDAQAGNSQERLGGVEQQIVFVPRDAGQAEALDVVDGCAQADGVGDAARAGFETGGRHVVHGFLESDVNDHAAAALPRLRVFENVELTVNGANPGGSENFVPGEHVEIAVQQLHVDRHVRNSLCAVE